MSFGISAAAWTAIAAVVGAGYSAYAGNKASDAQTKAQQQNLAAAQQQQATADQQLNKANARAPDTAGITSQLQQNAKGGQGSTLLSGPLGVDQSTLSLGKSTLLGG